MPTLRHPQGPGAGRSVLEAQVGSGFSKQLLTDQPRAKHGFKGIVVSDWAITNDCGETCLNGFPPGVKPSFAGLSHRPRGRRGEPGQGRPLRQGGANARPRPVRHGVEDTAELVAAVKAGKIAPARSYDDAARRILAIKFEQGLFENPYVDAKAAAAVVGARAFVAEGRAAQSAALTLLENKNGLLPLKAVGRKVWLKGVSPDVARSYAWVPVEILA
ncbi:hypothetical protein ACRAWD_09745 [Caulobacter segnis]